MNKTEMSIYKRDKMILFIMDKDVVFVLINDTLSHDSRLTNSTMK
ncbi:MAG: hypothetical protein ACD_73C00514G0001 [uncultured bacterium]|nr:MAG: hypothetical protein ACD_73C00514G0001 [uncultured bacterium]